MRQNCFHITTYQRIYHEIHQMYHSECDFLLMTLILDKN